MSACSICHKPAGRFQARCYECIRAAEHEPQPKPDPRIFGAAKVGNEAIPRQPSARFKGGVVTPHGEVSFHSEHEAARDYIWGAVSDKLDRDFPRSFGKVQP